MTCREQLKIDHPDCWRALMMEHCPRDFGYLKDPDRCDCLMCTECWGREIPETSKLKTEKPSNHPESGDIHSAISDILGIVAGGTGYIKIGLEKGKITNIYTELEKEF